MGRSTREQSLGLPRGRDSGCGSHRSPVKAASNAPGPLPIVRHLDALRTPLIFVGRSSTQVRQEHLGSYLELLDDEERGHASAIQMQQWSGFPDAGRWVFKSDLKLPAPARRSLAA